jgi:predicted aspartyl protease
MKFPYREYLSVVPGSSDYRLILRPVIPIRIVGTTGETRCDALVDSGADECLFPMSVADALGIEFDPQQTSEAAGISGDRLKISYGEVEIQIEHEEQAITWKTSIGFANYGSPDDEVVILGHGGCLDFFTATFDGELAELELVPNSLLPGNVT